MSTVLLLDQGPKFPDCNTREPSIRQMIHSYYEKHFPLSAANQLATHYIRLSEAPTAKPTFFSSLAHRKWESLMDEGHRMSVLSFERSLNGVDQKGTIDAWGKVMWEETATPKNPLPADWLEDREFYEAMQAYRWVREPESITVAFDRVKDLIRKRTERCIPSKELEGLPVPLPMPPLPISPYQNGHGIAQYDRFLVHSYAMAYADASMRALLGIKAPMATSVVCSYDNWKPERTIS